MSSKIQKKQNSKKKSVFRCSHCKRIVKTRGWQCAGYECQDCL